MALPILVAFFLLSNEIPGEIALEGVLGGWLYAGNASLSSLKFYQSSMGIIDMQFSLYTIALCMLGYTFVFGVPIISCFVGFNRFTAYSIAMIPVLLLYLFVFCRSSLPISLFARPLPIFVLVLGLWSLYMAVKRKSKKSAFIFVLSIFGFALLTKMLLNVRIYHYGFVLAMPAFMLAGVLFFDLIPRMLRDRNRQVGPYIAATSAALVLIVGLHLNITKNMYSRKIMPVSSERDFFYSGLRGHFVNEVVKWIDEYTTKDATVFVLPEGVMINYLSRRINPVPVVNLMPPELMMFGQGRLLNAVMSESPDYVVVVHKDTSEYGFDFFGKGYGNEIYDWIQVNYKPAKLVGSPPLRNDRFGIMVLRKVD
ncbi:MAG: hypothetical protein U5R49_03700 [Deltaproteobacteria bacterium]|nr:hypothetical protein [Deltaproteobacteria bacterium]